MIYIGVDTGSKGAVAAIYPSVARVVPMPALPMEGSRRHVYNTQRLGLMFRELRDSGQVALVVIEQIAGFPPGTNAAGIQSAAAGPALFEGLCSACAMAYTLVIPQVWQRELLALPKRKKPTSDDPADRAEERRARRRVIKGLSVATAQRLFPGVSLFPTERSTVPSDGMAEALLLAAYARQLHAGGALFAQRSA